MCRDIRMWHYRQVPVGNYVRQGCILYTNSSSLYKHSIMSGVEDDTRMRTHVFNGFTINGHEIYELRYSDDTALLSDNK